MQRWLLGLALTAGLDRNESARRTGDLLGRLGLAHASGMSLHALSRGSAQRALVAQALLAHRVDGRELARAFAARVGGRARAPRSRASAIALRGYLMRVPRRMMAAGCFRMAGSLRGSSW